MMGDMGDIGRNRRVCAGLIGWPVDEVAKSVGDVSHAISDGIECPCEEAHDGRDGRASVSPR